MHITGFLQNRNNVSNGYLRWCLHSMRLLADSVVVYDDASDEEVTPVYQAYDCTVVYGRQQAFHRELFHKQQLLVIAQRYRPDWIVWFDSDAILSRFWEDREKAVSTLEACQQQGIELLHLHNLNLWRSFGWYRTDQAFNDLWHGVFWFNTGELQYRPTPGLHQRQYPFFHNDQQTVASRFDVECAPLIHLGFAREEEIARKYFTYRATGQTGWPLDRLVHEGDLLNPQTGQEESFTLEEVPPEWYPEWFQPNLPTSCPRPEPLFDPEQMATYDSYASWCHR